MVWTDQQIQTLKQMWGNGYSANDIAKNLGGSVTRNAVIGKAHRLKLSVGMASSAPRAATPPSKTKGVVMASITKVSKGAATERLSRGERSFAASTIPTPSVRKALTPEPVLKPIEIMKRSEGIPVTNAGERHCRWPIGDPRSPDFRFCGCETQEGLPYCTHHARIAYQTISRKSRANASADAVAMDFNNIVVRPDDKE